MSRNIICVNEVLHGFGNIHEYPSEMSYYEIQILVVSIRPTKSIARLRFEAVMNKAALTVNER
jgi:hypothetical protein